MRSLLLIGFISAQLIIINSLHQQNPPLKLTGRQGQSFEIGQTLKHSSRPVVAERERRIALAEFSDTTPMQDLKMAAIEKAAVGPSSRQAAVLPNSARRVFTSHQVNHEPLSASAGSPVVMLLVVMRGVAVSTASVQNAVSKTQSEVSKKQSESVTVAVSVESQTSATAAKAQSDVTAQTSSSSKEPSASMAEETPISIPMSWTMINVCGVQGQADCHLLEFPDGQHVLIDAAEGWDTQGVALAYLQSVGIKHLDLVVLSHVHWDHYGKLIDIINSGIQVDRVAVNMPASREIADAEIPWGCNWDDVQAMLLFLKDHGIPYWTPQFGEKLLDVTSAGVESTLEVVCYYDGINTPVGRTDVNDTSMLIRLRHGSIKALFTGDLNNPIGTWLASSDFDLKADILKVPHHGTEGVAPNAFFDRVAPQVALVPSPKDLWLSDRSSRVRNYFQGLGIPTYISGIDGSVTVTFSPDHFDITTTGVQDSSSDSQGSATSSQ